MEKIREFLAENRLAILIGLLLLILICWLHHDANRNKPVYNDTDGSLERIEKRLDDIGQRVDILQKRNAENKETVIRITETVERSRENAETVTGGITEAERRLDSAIQASGRIKNRIEDIERTNK